MSSEITYIGCIKTPYNKIEDCPNNIQPNGPLCHINLDEHYHDGLQGLTVGQHILILYWLENANRTVVIQRTSKGNQTKGTFALRSPHRPNPIGAAVLPIESIEGGQISVRGLDCLNNTRLIDIKPAIYQETGS
ncbi:tRNA (N6-threonylcarbamoyladenosine(37)-N6)-methyltransferase TrmO [Photobacterium kasasachensis]|uniref:tRNA (N6-threonylcarbamoyladenosine(37)-N6)-methyltransferase TrmO n=1 Tax=Photobacterium kasasachensis TaxID=2910240 RepID=UPI003D0AE199